MEAATRKAQWKPPVPMPEKPKPRKEPEKPIPVEPACVRRARSCWRCLPRPPRWWWLLSRSIGSTLEELCGAVGFPAPCPCWVEHVTFSGLDADCRNEEVQEMVDAMGMTPGDLRTMKAAFRDCDWDNGGDVSTDEFMAWLGEKVTPFSRSLFRLADLDDSGFIDFA